MSFLVGAGCLALMRVVPVVVAARTTVPAELRAGWKAFSSRSWVWITVAWFVPVIAVAALLDGASATLFNLLWFTALQRDVPAGELARVSSWDYLGSLALLPVGRAAAGPVAEAIGLSTTLYAAGGLLLVLVLGVLAVPAICNFSGAETPSGDR